MSKTMIRIVKNDKNPYTMINNTLLHDPNLSWKAKGILAYLLSLPDDWKVYETELVKHSKDGIDSLRSGVNELIENGYIYRTRTRGEDGKFGGYNYSVYEEPIHIGLSKNGKTKNGLSKNGESNTTNTNITNTNITNTNITNEKNSASSDTQHALSSKTKDTSKKKEDKQLIEEAFESMWKLYPVKKGKGQVKHEGRKRIHKLGDEFKRCINRYINEVEEERRKGFKELRFQQGSTFFNSGYVDYLDKNYEGGNANASSRCSVDGSYSEVAKTDYSHLTESKRLTDAEREQNERELEELGYF